MAASTALEQVDFNDYHDSKKRLAYYEGQVAGLRGWECYSSQPEFVVGWEKGTAEAAELAAAVLEEWQEAA